MFSWFEKIQAEMDKIDPRTQDLIKNLGPVTKKDTVVGVLNDDLKKLLLLSVRYCDLYDEATKPTKIGELKEFLAKVRYNREMSEALRSIFWLAVADTFGSKAAGKNLSLRDDWTIVELEDKENRSAEYPILDEILGKIFGHSVVVMSGMSDFSEIFGGKRPH